MQSYSDYKRFAREKLEADFNDIEILVTSLTHRSYINEHRKTAHTHNERLEFLGDAVIELVVTNYLYKNFKEPEGILTSWRSSLVRTESLAEAAESLGLFDYLRLSRGEKRGSQRAREQILANAFEAVVGALYLDQGLEAVEPFLTKNLLNRFRDILAKGSWQDPKSQLQESVQSREGSTPIYKVLSEQGPDHDKIFTVGVFVKGKLRGQGVGPSKQAAQVSAAEAALTQAKP